MAESMLDRITISQNQMGDVPCIRGLRIPIVTVVGMITDGMSVDEVLQAYPDLKKDDISVALAYAALPQPPATAGDY